MNIHPWCFAFVFFSSKRLDNPYLAVTQAPTPKNPLVAISSKRRRRSRISRSRPHEHINLGLPFKRESRDLKQLTFVKVTATITYKVAWIDNGVHRPSHRIWRSPGMPKTLGIWEWGCPYHCDRWHPQQGYHCSVAVVSSNEFSSAMFFGSLKGLKRDHHLSVFHNDHAELNKCNA